jgi:dihydroorotate dehydrogenase (NAD+) catalytic subunit
MLYDPSKTYDENVANGPFLDELVPYVNVSEPQYEFLGHKIYSPFGIAAGTLPSSRHTSAAFQLGYDVVVYKTQRSDNFPCNQFPNILPLELDGDLSLERLQQPLVALKEFPDDISRMSITNSFGVPSRAPSVWVDDFKQALSGVRKGQLLIMAVMGTIREGMSPDNYYDDFAVAAAFAKDTGAQIIEINLSCPNVATEGIICYSHEATVEICKRAKAAIGEIPLLVKVGYYSHQQQAVLEAIVRDISPYVAGISAINTLQGTIVNENGEQALPGKGRLKSGVCGACIRWAGLDMVKRLDDLRKENGYTYQIIGVGGVMTSDDFHAYRAAGADVVQAVTAPMWHPKLAEEVKASLLVQENQ